MDSQHSGSNKELVVIETSKVLFVLKGEKYGMCNEAEVHIDPCGHSDNEINIDYHKSTDTNEKLHLKEYSDYEIIMESKKGASLEFYHDNLNIRNKVTPITSRSKNLSGIINFRGDIGLTEFVIKADNHEEFKITLEVFPSKISYKEDYKALLNDVNEEIYNLAYGFLARTYLGAEINNNINNNDTEFYSILNYVFEKLKKSIDIVLNNPNHVLHKENRVVKYSNIKKVTKDTIKYLEKRPYLMENTSENRYMPSQALITKKTITMNTKENRLLKFMLLKIVNKIDRFLIKYNKSSWNSDEYIVNKLKHMKKEIIHRINSSFLRNINEQFNDASMSLVFSMGSGYRDVFKLYIMLQKGLSISSNIFSLSIKELSLLYEYWCFIKINSLLKKKYKLISSDLLKINRNGITVSLVKGKRSSLTYENPMTNERFTVHYNFTTASKTVNQKPDNILSMHKDGSSKSYEFIFDAKYKIDYRKEYIKAYNTPGPKEEDINTMHRYRDAIISDYSNEQRNNSMNVENPVFGAFVLFPYNNEEEFKKNKFYKSIEKVNIGAIPFLPSTTKLMEEFLNEIINESSYSTFERTVDKVNREEYLSEDKFKVRNVLIGIVKSKEQFEANFNNNFYHIPLKSVNLAAHGIKYIALYQTKNAFKEDGGIQYCGQVSNIEIVKRNEIRELPKESNELYYRIEISEWKKLDRKIEINNFSLRRSGYTNLYFINNAENVSELFIKTYKEFRLFKELKRISSNRTSFQYNEEKVDAFSVDDLTVMIQGDYIKIIRENMVIGQSYYYEFLKSPVKTLRELLYNS